MPARVRRVNRQSSSRLHIFFPHHSRATAPRDAASARHRSSSSPSTRICTVSSASRTRPNRAPTLPFFSFNATISRQDGESLVSLRSTRPRAPVRRPSPPRSRRRSRARDASFPSSFDFSPVSRPVSRARDRARIAPRAPAFVVATGAAAFRFDARVIAPRPPSAASAREVVPLRTLASMAFLSFIDRAIEIEIAVSTRTQRRSIAIAVRARARVPTDRPPTADASRRGEATPRRRGGDGTRRDSATRSTASARANERERARTSANERERARGRCVDRPTTRAPATAPHVVFPRGWIIQNILDGFDGRGDERAIER